MTFFLDVCNILLVLAHNEKGIVKTLYNIRQKTNKKQVISPPAFNVYMWVNISAT